MFEMTNPWVGSRVDEETQAFDEGTGTGCRGVRGVGDGPVFELAGCEVAIVGNTAGKCALGMPE